jgi:hypothetical protein
MPRWPAQNRRHALVSLHSHHKQFQKIPEPAAFLAEKAVEASA